MSCLWDRDRRLDELPALGAAVYLDHARRSPPTVRTLRAASAALEACARGALAIDAERAAADAARAGVSRVLGWPADCVAFTQNTTTALATVARAVPWTPGDRVLLHADEDPGNLLPWLALESIGVRVEMLPSRGGRLDPDDLAGALRSGPVRALSFAAVCLRTGQRRDVPALTALARARGGEETLVVLDVAQALGGVGVDLRGVDAVAGCARKWLMGVPDLGILALRPGLAESLGVPTGGAGSREGERWRAEALRFEGGAVSGVALAGLASALEQASERPVDALEARVLELASAVADEAAARGLRCASPGGSERSPVVHLGLPADAPADEDLERGLAAAGVVLRVRERQVRIAPHFWNDAEDLERAFAALGSLGVGGRRARRR